MNIEIVLQNRAKKISESKPQLFNLSKRIHRRALKKLLNGGKINHIVDDYLEQIKEYFIILNPNLLNSKNLNKNFGDFLKKLTNKSPLVKQGIWVYFPWCSTISHILSEDNFFKVRTARNQNLITADEQKKFYDATVGVAGLSIGNSAALAIILQGGARHIKLADHDKLTLSNTNRIRTGVTNLGLPKIQMTARQIYELNPYAKIEVFLKGLNEKNINTFCSGLDIIVDEVDDLAIKYLLRYQAKKRKLPVIMAADNSDNGIIDIERYDLNPKTRFFNGRLGKISYNDLNNLDKYQTGRLIVKLLGVENINLRTYESFLEMGKTLASWPQLGGAALLNGSAVAYCVRKIISIQPLQRFRSIVSLDAALVPNFNSAEKKAKRIKASKKFKKILVL